MTKRRSSVTLGPARLQYFFECMYVKKEIRDLDEVEVGRPENGKKKLRPSFFFHFAKKNFIFLLPKQTFKGPC
jgi:hypothetical protein